MNFFHHNDLGNHLLQLCSKVVEHPVCVYIYIYIYKEKSKGIYIYVYVYIYIYISIFLCFLLLNVTDDTGN